MAEAGVAEWVGFDSQVGAGEGFGAGGAGEGSSVRHGCVLLGGSKRGDVASLPCVSPCRANNESGFLAAQVVNVESLWYGP